MSERTLGQTNAPKRIAVQVSGILYFALAMRYVYWHLTHLPRAGSIIEGLFLATAVALEVLFLQASLRLLILLASTKERTSEAEQADGWWRHRGLDAPRVAIMIPTYGEPVEVLERTILGALDQDYPAVSVWVLDDGNRAAVRALAAELGVEYVVRAERKDAKAGNLNHGIHCALGSSAPPEFIAVLDADFVPMRPFVRRVLALLSNGRVAIVQTPQLFYNAEVFQCALPAAKALPDSVRLIFDDLHPARDARGMAPCCGTSFMMRVAAWWDIGGFPAGCATEDLLTAVEVRRHGWSTAYLNEPLSFGLATERLSDFFSQRRRWGLGHLQLVRYWLGRRTPHLLRRILIADLYLQALYLSLGRLILLWCPAVYWLLGWRLFAGEAAALMANVLPVLLLHRILLTGISNGRFLPIYSEAISTLVAFAHLGSWRDALFTAEKKFVVTPKGTTHGRTVFHLAPILCFGACGIILVGGVLRWVLRDLATDSLGAAMAIWSIYNLFVIVVCLSFAIERPRFRREDRQGGHAESVIVDGAVARQAAIVEDLSSSGMLIEGAARLVMNETVTVWMANLGGIPGRVVRRAGAGKWGIRLEASGSARRRLIRHVYSTRYLRPIQKGRLVDLCRGVARRWIGRAPAVNSSNQD